MSMSLSTVSGTAGVLPTPSSCSTQSTNFQYGPNQSGCTFTPKGSDLQPYTSCCKSAPVQTYSNGCGFYCDAKDQDMGDLQSCLTGIASGSTVQCQSNDGSNNSQSSSNTGGHSGNVNSNINEGNCNGDSCGDNGAMQSSMMNAFFGSNGMMGAGAFGSKTTASASTSVPSKANKGQSTASVSTQSSTSISAVNAAATSFSTSSGTPTSSQSSSTSSFTGAAAAVLIPAAGMTKGGMFAVGLLVLSTITGAML